MSISHALKATASLAAVGPVLFLIAAVLLIAVMASEALNIPEDEL